MVKASLGLVLLLALITPGAALWLLQQWTPTLVALSGLAGTALALAIRNFHKIRVQDQRLELVERLTPRRVSDQAALSACARDVSALPASRGGSPANAAGSPRGGESGIDG